MIKKIISSLALIVLLASAPISGVSANSNINFSALDFTNSISFDGQLNWPQQFSVKKDVPYDASKDSALRRGTENRDEPQGSFFVVPAVIFGIIALLVFLNRE
uniref:hypothetical protein n=1 Tax=Crenothrix polyspora TaxID=360316 RepID=UPI000B35A929|nr:hypothetical protein [Crenothrix polyspora]